MNIAELLLRLNPVLAKALDELLEFGDRNPDLKPVSDRVREQLAVQAAEVGADVQRAITSVVDVFQRGQGPIDPDPVDLS